MKVPLIDLWLRIRASYWFVPTLMVVGATGASMLLVYLEPAARELLGDRMPSLFASQPRGTQALLSTIAGSMITVAGVTFSMTLLALSHATAQLGPGLLSEFMRDRGNQFTLGTFVATFVYCLLVLRTAQDTGSPESAMVPHLATLGALALAFASVGVLIYFFHHVPQSINVERLITNVGNDLVRSIRSAYPDRSDRPAHDPQDDAPAPKSLRGKTVAAGSEGYFRVVDREGLTRLASERGIVIRLLARPGDYLLPEQAFVNIDSEDLDDDGRRCLLECFSVGFDRTPEQDVLLSVERLLEIMGKSLSPGINNQQTATHCIDQLFRGLAVILRRDPPRRHVTDDDGHVRIINDVISHEDFIRAVCRPMRQYVAGDWIATRYLLRRFDALLALGTIRDDRIRRVLTTERDAFVAEAAASDMPSGLQQAL